MKFIFTDKYDKPSDISKKHSSGDLPVRMLNDSNFFIASYTAKNTVYFKTGKT